MAVCQFWFEFASPYTYIAAMRIGPLAEEAGVEIEYRPFLLGPILTHLGSRPPALGQPWKVPYMIRDLERLSRKYGIAFAGGIPIEPAMSLLAARAAVIALEQAWGPSFVREVFRARFELGLDISDRQVIMRVLSMFERDAEGLMRAATSGQNKLELRRLTEEAERLGIFGSPTFISDGEMFWGQDRLEDALAWAGQQAPERSGAL